MSVQYCSLASCAPQLVLPLVDEFEDDLSRLAINHHTENVLILESLELSRRIPGWQQVCWLFPDFDYEQLKILFADVPQEIGFFFWHQHD
jgi:hypothetical protein